MQLRDQFYLKPGLTFLNFGSFGACPKPVMQQYQAFQTEMEADPVDFMLVKGPAYLQQSREALADFIGCHADDVVYVTNPSYAVNIIAKSLHLQPGDEVLATNIEYGACDTTWSYYCNKKGATYVRQPINFPLQSKDDFVEQFIKGITKSTKLIFISHLTSSTGLRLPVEEICSIAKERGIMTFVDGAHAPGQIDLELNKLQADIYTGACHKWMMTPKGSSFLFVNKSLQHLFDPLVISWGYNSNTPSHSTFLDYHQMQGTRDYTAFLCIPAAIQFMQNHDWDNVRTRCRKLTQDNALRFCKLLNAEPLCVISDDFIQQLYSIRINTQNPQKLHDHLYKKYNIQIPVMVQDPNVYLRYSIQGFNTQQDLDNLYDAIIEIKNDGQLQLITA